MPMGQNVILPYQMMAGQRNPWPASSSPPAASSGGGWLWDQMTRGLHWATEETVVKTGVAPNVAQPTYTQHATSVHDVDRPPPAPWGSFEASGPNEVRWQQQVAEIMTGANTGAPLAPTHNYAPQQVQAVPWAPYHVPLPPGPPMVYAPVGQAWELTDGHWQGQDGMVMPTRGGPSQQQP